MGFLTESERATLRIEAMILHVVGGEDFEPKPLHSVEHSEFFIERILETDNSGVYEFKDISRTRDSFQQIAQEAISFEEGAQEVSREFSRLHAGGARDGAFFVFDLRTDNEACRIYSLIKYDYKQVIERSEEKGRQRLRKIVDAFVDDKRSIQKSALIRVVGGRAETAVATMDRTKRAPNIADYFATFLDVQRTRSDEELNLKLIEALRQTFVDVKQHLPNQDVASAMQRAKGILRDRQQINEAAIIEAVIVSANSPEEPDIVEFITKKTAVRLRNKKLTGLAFAPVPGILRRPSTKKIRTTEGVVVTYPSDVDAVRVTRTRHTEGTGETITITTDQVIEDVVLEDRS